MKSVTLIFKYIMIMNSFEFFSQIIEVHYSKGKSDNL